MLPLDSYQVAACSYQTNLIIDLCHRQLLVTLYILSSTSVADEFPLGVEVEKLDSDSESNMREKLTVNDQKWK